MLRRPPRSSLFPLTTLFRSRLHRLVGHVLLLRPEEQVVGIDAGPHVAAMADQQALRNGAVPRHPGNTAGQPQPPLPAYVAVAIVVATRHPEDAAGLGIAHAV